MTGMITTRAGAVKALVEAGNYGVPEKPLKEIVAFLRKNPDETYELCEDIKRSPDATNHRTPFARVVLLLGQAVKG